MGFDTLAKTGEHPKSIAELAREQAAAQPVWDSNSMTPLHPGINHIKLKMPIKNGGSELREVDAYVPASYKPDTPMPMAIMLDGVRPSWDQGSIEKTSGLDKVAEKLSFIAIYPHADVHEKQTHLFVAGIPIRYFKPPGTDAASEQSQSYWEAGVNWIGKKETDGFSWLRNKITGYKAPELTSQGFLKEDETRDVRFLKAITDSMPQLANVDKDRVYIAGFSIGGQFAQYQAAYQSDTYAGVGSIHGTLLGYEPPQPAGQKTAFFGILSKPDKVLPMKGGGVIPYLLEQPGHSDPENQWPRWVASNGCTGNPITQVDSATADITVHYEPTQCTSGRGVEEIIRKKGLHAVDGDTEDSGIPVVGVPDRNFQAAEKMMAYLLQFRLRDAR
jgi:poly(3-hydroxybutyrate) depolymerase